MTDIDIDRPWVVDSTPNPRFPVLTRANVSEVAPNVVKPLFGTMISGWTGEVRWRKALIEYGAFDADEFRPDQSDIMPVLYGYYYLNVSVHRVMGARTPGIEPSAMDVAFFGENPDVPPYEPQPGDDDPKYAERISESMRRILDTTALPDLDEDRIAAAKLREARPDFTAMSDAELLDYARTIVRGPFRVNHEKVYALTHKASIPVAMLGQVLSDIGTNVPGVPSTVELLAGLGDIDSAAPSYTLWELGRSVRASATLTTAFDQGVEGLRDRLAGTEEGRVFLARLDDFLYEHGSRGTNEWDICSITWETHQDIPLRMIERLRLQADTQSPVLTAERLRTQREAAAATVREKLAGTDALASFETALRASVLYSTARERNKTSAVRTLQEARLALRELSTRLVERGHFAHTDDINMLRDDELDDLLEDPARWAAIAHERLAWAEKLQLLEPPYVVDGSIPPPSTWRRKQGDHVHAAAAVGDVLQGLPACSGTAEGRARIVTDPDEADRIEPGDVLVAPMTDPGWTPLFLSAVAVVVNTGSGLSHAAIVSRELGVPSVVGLSGATEKIPDGARVRVDGTTGTVILL